MTETEMAVHAHSHVRPTHHVGPCDESCRKAMSPHAHLYRGPEGARTRAEFERGYVRRFEAQGESPAEAQAHARLVYGATVGKVKREQLAVRARGTYR